MKSIESTFLEYHRDKGFATYESFPLIIDDPTVLFTNATITPFKPMFTGDMDFTDFALVQRCLRLGGTGGTTEAARHNLNYTSLFNMLGSGVFEIDHDDAVEYFVDMLDALGLDRTKMIFSSIGGHALNSALTSSSLNSNQVRVFEDPNVIQHEWSFGEGDLHGVGVIAWHSEEGYEQSPDLNDCVQIGRIVHIDGISEGGTVRPFDYAAFDVGLGMGRVELALTGANDESMRPLRNLSSQLKSSFEGISDGDAHYMSNLCRVIDELTAEGLMPGNKKHAYVLRKIIRSLVEEVWLQSGQIVDAQDALGGFIEVSADKSRVEEALSSEEVALRGILANVTSIQTKHPEMTQDQLHATFGIKPSLLKLISSH
jgi:alanyl-tRNA synthetase